MPAKKHTTKSLRTAQVYTHPVLMKMGGKQVCLQHLERFVAIALSIRDDFSLVGEGVCDQCDAESKWAAIPSSERQRSKDDGKGTIIVGDPRDPFHPLLSIKYGIARDPKKLSVRGLRMRAKQQEFERAYPTADERKIIGLAVIPRSDNASLDTRPRRKKRLYT